MTGWCHSNTAQVMLPFTVPLHLCSPACAPARKLKYTVKWTPIATLPYFLNSCFTLSPPDMAGGGPAWDPGRP